MSASPILKALDLTRVNIDAMTVEDLQFHANEVLNTLSALNDFINSRGRKSANSTQAALYRARLLRMHMARVRDVMQAHQDVAAMTGAAQTAGVVKLAPSVHPLGI